MPRSGSAWRGFRCCDGQRDRYRIPGTVVGLAVRGISLFADRSGEYSEDTAPDPGSAPVNFAWAAQDPGVFCASGPAPARHQAKDGEGPGRCLAHRGLPGKSGCPSTRDPLLAEERVR
jgi:hypothetical protein